MNDWKIISEANGKERHFDTRNEAEQAKRDLPGEYDIQPVGEAETPEDLEPAPSSAEDIDARTPDNVPVIDESNDADELKEGYEKRAERAESKPVTPEELSKDPINFLKQVNGDFVNIIKGKPAISKRGFRFIQREFEISTESKVVQWSEDPLGCVVWARAELPSGYSAEAHGEGYQFESDVSDNEFVRYADTRAKNRALSDLTSAGALAVSELQGEKE